MRFLPNDLYEFIEKCKSKPLNDIISTYSIEDQITALEYVEFLTSNELAFHTNQPFRFPQLDLSWKSPCNITNAVIDINCSSNHDYQFIIDGLNRTRCQSIDFRIFEHLATNELKLILDATMDSTIQSIKVYIPYTMRSNEKKDKMLFEQHKRLNTLVFHGAPENSIVEVGDSIGVIIYLIDKIDSPQCCGYVSEELMVDNLSAFTEASHYNSCLNRKLSIDTKGFVKNCNLQNEHYGHYKETCFSSLVKDNKDFSKYWSVNKDSIDICKICEFRYSCIDCRYIIADECNILSKPKRCNYDPYTATWS